MPSLVRMPTGLNVAMGQLDQFAVVALQRGVVVAGDQHPLAAGREIGGQLPAQPRVFDLGAQMGLA